MNWKRISLLMKADLRSHRRALVIVTLSCFLITTALLSTAPLGYNLFFGSNQMQEIFKIGNIEANILTHLSYTGTIVDLIGFVVLTCAFHDLWRRSGETAHLMLPATNAEKWTARTIGAILLGIVIPIACNYFSVLLSAGIVCLYSPESAPELLKLAFTPDTMLAKLDLTINRITFYASTYVINIAVWAYFLFASTFFRRNSWLYGLLWGIVIYIILSVGSGFAVGYYVAHTGLPMPSPDELGSEYMLIMLMKIIKYLVPAAILASAALLWGSYRSFCRRQLTAKEIKTLN